MSEVKREILGWTEFGTASRELATQVHEDGYEPDLILAIVRGGLLVAGALGYALEVKNCFVMNVEYYTGVNERLDFPVILPAPLNLVDLENAKVLVADDVADTGHTLRAVYDFIEPKVSVVKSAVLYEKPQSLIKCDYIWKRTADWIDFPWSCLPPVVGGPGEG